MKYKIKRILIDIWRFPLRCFYKFKLKNKNFTILSSNCIGGGYYHDTFQRFNSPTINLTIPDFLTFVENIDKINEFELVNEGVDKKGRCIASLNGIIINGIHYKDFDSLKLCWHRRVKRINFHRQRKTFIFI